MHYGKYSSLNILRMNRICYRIFNFHESKLNIKYFTYFAYFCAYWYGIYSRIFHKLIMKNYHIVSHRCDCIISCY